MTETSVIKHYKKQLIYRQHDLPVSSEKSTKLCIEDVDKIRLYEIAECETNNNSKNDNSTNGKKVRRKRKNRNCRGQFRHEAMELIKLGTNSSHSLCKTKEPYNARLDKQVPIVEPPTADSPKDNLSEETTKSESAFDNNLHESIMLLKTSPLFGHALPQMVPERQSNRDPCPPKSPTSSVLYRSLQSEYRVPVHPPYNLPLHQPYHTYSRPRSPPYSPPRRPIRPIPQPAPYSGFHFSLPSPYSNGYHPPPVLHPIPTRIAPNEYPERKKRKHPPDGEKEPQVVAAIDLTVDHDKKVPEKHHKCQCECGKVYASKPSSQAVVRNIANEKDSTNVPSAYLRGKMTSGVLQLNDSVDAQSKGKPVQMDLDKPTNKNKAPNKGSTTENPKLPQLFLIEDLLAKGEKLESKFLQNRIQDSTKNNSSIIVSPTKTEKTPVSHIAVPIRTEPNRVIVSDNHEPSPQPKDYSVNNLIGNNRRQSVDIDTISISSSSSESLRSPRPKSNGSDKQIPQGKLFYYKNNNSFIRYFDDTQKKLFLDNLIADGSGYEIKQGDDHKETIELPPNTTFSCKDSLTVEEYVSEMTLVEKYIPKDFFFFYKFVTGYQICHNHSPVSFLTFLKLYNTNRLKVLLEKYINSQKTTIC